MTLDDILLQARKVGASDVHGTGRYTYSNAESRVLYRSDKRTIERGGHKDVNSADDSKTSGSVL